METRQKSNLRPVELRSFLLTPERLLCIKSFHSSIQAYAPSPWDPPASQLWMVMDKCWHQHCFTSLGDHEAKNTLHTSHTHTFLTVDSPKYLNSTILYTSNFLKQRRWATNRPFLLSAATRYANGLMCCFLFEPCKYHRPAVKWRTRSKTGGTLIMG